MEQNGICGITSISCDGLGAGNGGVGFDSSSYAAVSVVPPVFSSFAGKAWELQYPVMVGRYFDCLERVIDSGYFGKCKAPSGRVTDSGIECGTGRFTRQVGVVSSRDDGDEVITEVKENLGSDGQFLLGSSQSSVGSGRDALLSGVVGNSGSDRGDLAGVGVAVGPNYERNRLNRENKKRRKARKRAVASENWRVQQPIQKKDKDPVVPVVDGVQSPVTNCGSKGFWNSCSDDVRQQLIDSKARMHIADNLKRAEEAERKVQQLRSPEQLLRDAMRMVKFAEEQAKDKNDSKVRGWAKTVAESYAESIARSASASVESFDKYLEGNSSLASVSLEVFEDVVKEKDQLVEDKKKLQEEIDRLKGKKELQKYVVSTEVQTMQRYAAAAKKSVKKPVCSQEHFLKVQAEKTKGVQDPYAFPWNYDREIVEYEPAKY